MADRSEVLLEQVRVAMRNGARLDVVRMLFNPTRPWGVQVWEKAKTRGGNDKWVKITLILPNEGETVVDVLNLLGTMVLEGD